MITPKQNGALLTIIVPAYNVEDYLAECLDSLVNQSMTNHKVVVVNDGSKDSTGDIAKAYAQKYPQMIRYVEQQNQGLGAARNAGLKYVDTEYVAFLDSDDMWLSRSVEAITEKITNCQEAPDIAFTQPIVFNMASQQYESWRDCTYLKNIFSNSGSILSARENLKIYATEASVCRCIVRMDFLNKHNIRFPEGVKWEDVFPHFLLLHYASRCVLVEGAGFCYRINSGNQITSLSGKQRLDFVQVFSQLLLFAIENKWNDGEMVRIVELMMEFTSWFMKSTAREYQKQLLDGVHSVYASVPRKVFEAYDRLIAPPREKKILWRVLRAPIIYKALQGRGFELAKKGYAKLKRILGR